MPIEINPTEDYEENLLSKEFQHFNSLFCFTLPALIMLWLVLLVSALQKPINKNSNAHTCRQTNVVAR